MTHAVLVKERRHYLAAGRLERDAERLVLDVGTQTAGIHLDGRLQAETPAAVATFVGTEGFVVLYTVT